MSHFTVAYTIDKKLRQQILRRDDFRCQSCFGSNQTVKIISIKGEVTESTPVNVYLDGQVIDKRIQKRLLRLTDAMK